MADMGHVDDVDDRTIRRAAGLAVIALLAALPTVGLAEAPAGADGNEAPGAPVATRSLAAGTGYTCVILDIGQVKCWGFGGVGALGQDNTDDLGDQAGEMAALNPINLGANRTLTATSTTNPTVKDTVKTTVRRI